jgi:hypothetical protein
MRRVQSASSHHRSNNSPSFPAATPMKQRKKSHQKPKTGAFHNQSHDTFVLEDWLNATRESGKLGPATLEQRSQVQDICASELFSQVRIGSPKIAAMLERVWYERTLLLKETISTLRHQVSVRDYAQTELIKVARTAGLHAERTKRLGNQWEIQRGSVMEELRDVKAELHSVGIERNQLRKETQQLREIIQEYVLGVGVKNIKQRESKRIELQSKEGKIISKNQSASVQISVAEENDRLERDLIRRNIVEDVEDKMKNTSNIGSMSTSSKKLEAGDKHYESEEEDIEDFGVRLRVKSIREADHQMDALLLDLMGEKRAQKAAIRGTQRLVKQLVSTYEASAIGAR